MKKLMMLLSFCFVANNSFGFKIPFINYGEANKTKVGNTYISAEDESLIFSWGKGNGYTSNVRFSMFLNTGVRYNYVATKKVIIYSGLTLRNVGIADRIPVSSGGTSVIRARNYYLGVPVAAHIGNWEKGTFFDVGGGIDFTLHHKEKSWVEGSKGSTKQKYNQAWFDNKYSPFVNPYLFVATKVNGIGLKFQYYTGEFTKGSNINLMYFGILLPSGSGDRKNNKTKSVKKSLNDI
jgi:hypothetical protein